LKKKIKEQKELVEISRRGKIAGKKIIFTNGCFDLIHIGHIRYLEEAKKLGDILVVAINSDKSVRTIKGEKHPIISQNERAEILAALEMIDYVTIFDELDPQNIISALLPNVLVKGGDWEKGSVIGGETIEANGGKVVTIPVTRGASSSGIIRVILKRYTEDQGIR